MLYKFVVSFFIGIIFEKFFHFSWAGALLVILISISVFFVLYSKKENTHLAKIFLLVGLAFALGVLRMNFTNTSPDPNLLKLVGQKISFEAVISEEPDVRDTSARYTARPDNSKSLILLVSNRYPEFQYGTKIKVSGKLDLPKNFTTDNGTEFDYVSYLLKDKIHFLIYRPQIEKMDGGSGNKIISSLYSFKKYFIGKIGAVVPEPNSSFLAGLIFGAKQSLGEDLLADFQKVGLIHIVVLSGQNLTIVAAAILSITSYFGKRKFGLVASAFGIIIFSAMVGFTTTVLRASIMALIAILARYLGRPSDALRALFIAGFLMVVWNPIIIFYDPSFQLSFMAALGLILWSPVVDLLVAQKFRFIPQKFGIREIVSSTFAVQIFILPLLVRMSGIFSPVSFITNLIVLPIIPVVMFFGFLTGLAGMVPTIAGKFLSWPLGFVSYFVSGAVIKITELFASIPFSTISISALPLSAIFIWYVFYALAYLKLKKRIVL